MYTQEDVRKMLNDEPVRYQKADVPVFTPDHVTQALKSYKDIEVDLNAKYLQQQRAKKSEKRFSDVVPEFHKFEAGGRNPASAASEPTPVVSEQKDLLAPLRLNARGEPKGSVYGTVENPYSELEAQRERNPFGDTDAQAKWRKALNGSSILQGAQNLMEAANPVAKGVDTLRFLQNLEQANAKEDIAAGSSLAELHERAKTDPSVMLSKEYIDLVSRPANLLSQLSMDITQIDPQGESSADRVSSVLLQQSATAQNELLEGKTGLAKMGTQALISGADMIGAVGTAGMTGVPFLGLMGAYSGAEAGQRALDEGYDYGRAALFAAGTGGITAGIESFGGIAGKWGGSAMDALSKTGIGKAVLSKVPAAIGQKIAALASTRIGGVIEDALSEGAEEFAEYYAQNFFENLALDKNVPSDVREALENAAVGSMVGGLFGGGRAAVDLLAPLRGDAGVDAAVDADTAQGMAQEMAQGMAQEMAQEMAQGTTVQGTAQGTAAQRAAQGMAQDADLRPAQEIGPNDPLGIVAPGTQELNEAVQGARDYFFGEKEELTGERRMTGAESVFSHLGEGEKAFQDTKLLLEQARLEAKERAKAEQEAVHPPAEILNEIPKQGIGETFKETAQTVYRKMVDSGEAVQRVADAVGDEALYPAYNNAKQARQTGQYMIGEAQTDINGRETGKSLRDIFLPVRQKGEEHFRDFQKYLYHLHNIDRMTLENRGRAIYLEKIAQLEAQHPILAIGNDDGAITNLARRESPDQQAAREWLSLTRAASGLKNKPVFGSSVSAADSQAEAAGQLARHPEFAEMAEEVYRYNQNLMKWRIDAGLVSEKQADILNRLYPHYIPTYRGTGSPGIKTQGDERTIRISKTIKQATGSDNVLLPIDEAMARQTMQTVSAAKRNLFGNRLLEAALQNRDLVGREVQSIEDSDLDFDIDDPPQTDSQFVIYVGGEPVKMLTSPGMAEGIKAIMPNQKEMNKLVQGITAINNAFKALITGYNPFFLARNFFRDLQDAGLYTRDLQAFAKNYPRAWLEMKQNGELWKLYKAQGGTGSSYFDYESGIDKSLGESGIIDKIEAANSAIEQAPRFAEFIGVIEKGGTGYENVQKALLAAADVTVNFGRSGTLGKAINQTYVPFFNPSIQGADKMYRTFRDAAHSGEWTQLIGKAALLGIAPALVNALLYQDDEEYANISDRNKDTNFLFKVKDGLWLKVPKGRALAVLGNAAQRGMRMLEGEEEPWAEFFSTSIEATMPVNPFNSNIATPILNSDLLDPKSPGKTWYGGDIEPQRLQGLPPGQRYDESTDAISKAVGGALNVSPKKINYLLDSYSGIAGDMLLPLMTPRAERAPLPVVGNLLTPLVNAFTIDTTMSNKLSTRFYGALDDATYAKNSPDITEADREVLSYLNSASSEVADMNRRIRMIQNSEIEDAEKYRQVSEIKKEINALMVEALGKIDAIRAEAEERFGDIPQEVYYRAYQAQLGVMGDKDSDGKTVVNSASRNKKRAIDAVASGLTTTQKRKLYKAFGVSEKVW